MKNLAKLVAFMVIPVLSGVALAQTPPAASPAPAAAAPAAGRGGAPRAEWPPGYVEPGTPRPPYYAPETPLGTGPYKALLAVEPGAEEFGAYYPANLAALGDKKLPILIWGNGSCQYLGNRFRHFLTEIASHGYFALAGGRVVHNGGANETISIAQNNPLRNPDEPLAPPAPPAPPVAGAPPPNPQVTVELLSKGLDWALAENKRQGSKFFNKLDPNKVAVMGMSCGGGLASHFGSDKRVKTIGVFTGATMRATGYRDTVQVPTFLMTGDPRYDIGFYWGLADFEGMKKTKAPIFYAWRNNLTHLGTFRQENGGEQAGLTVAWLNWQLNGDREAAKMFEGPDCGLCTRQSWHVQKRNIP